MKKRLLLLLLFILLFAACSKGGGKDDYVVKIGDVRFTAEDVQAEMALLSPMARMQFQGNEGTARFMDELVKREFLYLEANKRGIEKNKDAQIKMEAAKKVALVNYFIEKEVEASGKISDKDIRDYYDSHQDDYTNRSQVKFSRIVVKSPEDAQKVIGRLKGGEDFARVAAEVSVDKDSAKAGGDMGYYDPSVKSKIDPDEGKIAMKLKRGIVSEPMPMNDGIHILKVTDIKGEFMAFEQVKMFLPKKVTEERKKAVLDKIMENARNNFKADINREALSKVPPIKKLPPMSSHMSLK
jgi:peptidyl-prolyl cis-trans isomerase C